jgi:LPXTG-motif cell wall-anchored protein
MKINSDNKVIVDFQHDQCQGKEITVTYDNLKNSYYLENIDNKTNKIKISKIERTFLGIHAGDTIFTSDGHTPTSDGVYDKCYGPQLIIYNDPYDGFFYNNIKQVSVKDIYYDDKGNPITFKDGDKNKAWIFVTSLNSDGVGNNNHRGDGKEYLEKVKAENPDDTPAEMKKIAGSTVTGPVDENTTKDFTRTVELFDGHSNGDYLRNYLRTNADDLKKQGWIWQENSSELTQTVTLHVKKTNDGYVYDNADAFFKGLTLPPISENGTEKYPDIEIPEVRVGTKTAVRIRVSYSANSSTQKPLDKPEVDVDEEEVPDTHDGWWYSDESNSPQNNYPDWDNKSEDNRYAFVGAVAIQYQPGMTITYGADDTAWGSHWACTQTQVVSTLNERVIIYDHIKDGVQEVTPETKPNDVPNNTVKEAQPDQLKVVVIRNIKYKLDNGSGKPDSMEDMNVPSSAIKQQIVKFDGTAYVDKVTGQLVNAIKDKNGNWIVDSNNSATPSIKWSVTNNGKLAGFEPPKIENYNNNQTHISEKTVQRPSQDTTETVYVVYSKIIKGSITVKVHDKTTNKDLSEYGEASGTNAVGTGFEYDKDTTIKKLTNAGYKVLNPKIVIPTEITKGNQVFTILVEHTITTITPETKPNDVPNNTVKEAQPDQLKVVVIRNIKYKLDNGSGKPDSMEDMNVPSSAIKQQIVKFDGTAYVDKVTGQLVNAIKDKNGNWIVDSNNSATPSIKWSVTNNGKLAGFEPPKIENYNNNQTHISEKTVQRPSQDTTETVYVVYSKIIKGSITVKVHDKTTNKDLSEYGEASGTNAVGTGFEYDKDTTIKKLTNAGYKVLNPKIVIPTEITKGNQVFTILVEHTITTITPDNPGHPGQPVDPDNPDGPKYPDGTDEYQVKRTGTQIIHYVGAGDKPPADNKQAFVFTREITFDNVTGKIISVTSWNVESHTFGNVDTPVIPGYHADKVVAGGATVTPDDLNRVITVTYAPDGNPGNPSDHGDTPSPEPTPEPEPTPNPTPDDQPDSETSSDEHFEKVKAKDKLDKTNPKKVAAYKKERKIIKTKIAKQGHTEIAEPIEDKVTRENNVKVVSDPVENMAAEPKLPQTGEADNSIIGLLGMLLASFAAMFGFDSLHSHDKKHKN